MTTENFSVGRWHDFMLRCTKTPPAHRGAFCISLFVDIKRFVLHCPRDFSRNSRSRAHHFHPPHRPASLLSSIFGSPSIPANSVT